MFISIALRATSIDETNKTQQKVRGSKFIFKMSTIHANTCVQTTVPLRNRCRDDGVHGPAASTPSADVLSTFSVLSTHIMDPRSVDLLLKHTPYRCCSPPDSNLANCVNGGHLWRDKLWRLSLQHGDSAVSARITCTMCWCTILLKNVVIPENSGYPA